MNMKKERKILLFTFSIIVFCIVGITVVYSILSTTLNINGNAEVVSASWDIRLEKFTDAELIETAIANYKNEHYIKDNFVVFCDAKVVKDGTVSDTLVKDFEWNFNTAGDAIFAFYKVTNYGSIPATLSEKEFLTPIYSSSTGSNDDIESAKKMLSYDIMFADINTGEVINGESLCPGESYLLVIGAGIFNFNSAVSLSDITVSNFGGYAIYNQSDDICES